jgi:hypothetical protein
MACSEAYRKNTMTREEAIEDLSGNYCCYCCEPQGSRFSCCSENHFVEFADLYEEDKEAMIEEYLKEESNGT